MKIRFGLQLDGQHGWAPAQDINVFTTGPLGMLTLLETQLGLLGISTSQSERIAQYRDCLKQANHVPRFYSASFAADELGTAATLLDWRDQWHLYGWNSRLPMHQDSRLKDLWEVERIAQHSVSPCLGERLEAIAVKMAIRHPAIDSITLVEPLAHFPKRWQTILRQLPCNEQPMSVNAAPGMLGEIQHALQQQTLGKSVAPLNWKADGSLNIVQAETRLLAARWLTTQLNDAPDDTLIVASEGASQLDDILAASGKARHGFKGASAFRPALQLLPLILEQIWTPLDIQAVLQFLTHPISPVHAIARTRIAEKLAKNPGIGDSPAWRECMSRIESACQDNAIDFVQVRANIDSWLNIPRFDRRAPQGAPIAAIQPLVQQLAEFFHKRLGTDDAAQRAVFNAAYQQSTACLDTLRTLVQQGETHLRPRQLQKLIGQVTAHGSNNPLIHCEVGSARAISQPAAAIESADQVIWWQLAMPQLPAPYPWSAQEIDALRDVGIELPALDEVLESLTADWLRPIFAAKQQLTLVLPPAGVERHPVWQMLASLFDPVPPITALETFLIERSDLPKLPLQALPTRERFWQLAEDTAIPRQGRDAFSSLESFIYNPYQWLVKYPAKLNASRLSEVSDSFLLFGTLAHDLAEIYFKMPDALNMAEQDFKAWFAAQFERLIDSDGVTLRAPGRGAELAHYRSQLLKAMQELRAQFAAAHVVRVEPESALTGHHQGGEIHGYADLVVTRADGTQAIVDLKWAGGKKYPEKLANNKHLQLIIYAELLRQKTSTWPHLAYFILSQGRLLALDNHFFPKAQVIARKKGIAEETSPQIWQRFQTTWAWRKAQQDDGLIELAVSPNDLKDGLSVWPEEGLAPDLTAKQYNDAYRLAGWDKNA